MKRRILPAEKILVIGAEHISEHDNNILRHPKNQNNLLSAGVAVYPYDYGMFLVVGDLRISDIQVIFGAGEDTGIVAILCQCACQDISFIQVDRDAETIEGFNTYDW